MQLRNCETRIRSSRKSCILFLSFSMMLSSCSSHELKVCLYDAPLDTKSIDFIACDSINPLNQIDEKIWSTGENVIVNCEDSAHLLISNEFNDDKKIGAIYVSPFIDETVYLSIAEEANQSLKIAGIHINTGMGDCKSFDRSKFIQPQ